MGIGIYTGRLQLGTSAARTFIETRNVHLIIYCLNKSVEYSNNFTERFLRSILCHVCGICSDFWGDGGVRGGVGGNVLPGANLHREQKYTRVKIVHNIIVLCSITLV